MGIGQTIEHKKLGLYLKPGFIYQYKMFKRSIQLIYNAITAFSGVWVTTGPFALSSKIQGYMHYCLED